MTAKRQQTKVRALIVASLGATGAAFGGTYSEPAAAPAPVAASGDWSWFTGASIGYLLDSENEIYHIHLGTEYHSPSGLSHGFFLEVGYTEGLESQGARTVTGNFEDESPDLETGLAVFDGEIEVIPVTLNYKLEGCFTDTFKWYVGAGIGAAFVDSDYSGSITPVAGGPLFPAIGTRFSDDATVFAAQIFAGVVWEVSESFEIYGGARYIYIDDPELVDAFTGTGVDVELDDYMVEGGLRFNF